MTEVINCINFNEHTGTKYSTIILVLKMSDKTQTPSFTLQRHDVNIHKYMAQDYTLKSELRAARTSDNFLSLFYSYSNLPRQK